MTIYSSVILLTELMMMAMVIHVVHYSGFTRSEKGWYVATFTAIMLCAAAEFSAIHFDARGRGFVVPLTIITVIQFSLSPMLPVFFSGALGMRREAKAVSRFFFLNVLAQIISAPFGWIFSLTKAGNMSGETCTLSTSSFTSAAWSSSSRPSISSESVSETAISIP